MPFDDDDKLPQTPKIGIKYQGKSIFDDLPKKPSLDEFTKEAQEVNKKLEGYGKRASELVAQFKKLMDDKTLPQNKNQFASEIEKEVISNMINLAIEINSDENEIEGMGSVGWIALILKYLLVQKDKINQLEYSNLTLENKIKEQNTILNSILNKLDIK
jgi:hypothetical protein